MLMSAMENYSIGDLVDKKENNSHKIGYFIMQKLVNSINGVLLPSENGALHLYNRRVESKQGSHGNPTQNP